MSGVRTRIRSTCAGCVNNWPSQKDHECLMESSDMADHALTRILKDFKPTEFIFALAKEAMEKNVILERPHQTLKLIFFCQLEDMSKKIVSAYD